MIITIHQIEHLPHISLFKKFAKANIIVLGDTFQFKKNYFENRNKIKANNKQGWQWITVPVQSHNHKQMKDIQISYSYDWQKKYLSSIKFNYEKAIYFCKYYEDIQYIISKNYKYLRDLNYHLIKIFLKWFNIKKEIILTSELNLNPELKGTDLLVEICKKVGADTYLSGASGRDYLELNKFGDIKVIFHEKEEGLSAIDHLFRIGGFLE
jgi:hypothetical protein